MLNPDTLLDDVCVLARQAGERVLEIYQSGDLGIQYKADKSPVTRADIAAHDIICAGLSKLTPQLPVLSEENGEDIPFKERAQWDIYWLVDPLDGTKGFIQHNGFFSVNIALIADHRPVLGVIYVPTDDALYYASAQSGAWKQTAGAAAHTITTRKDINDAPILVASCLHTNRPTQSMMESLGNIELIRLDGSLKCCVVAEGRADLYLRVGPTCEWDTAAAQCIVEEAGGYLSDISGKALQYNRKDSLLNPSFVVHTKSSPQWKPFM